jgi:alkylation response protein AidB-like acyl-CoA dehydrogenase
MNIKDFGGPGLTQLEAGAVVLEIAKRDVSISTFFLVHNGIGMEVIN